MRLAEYSLHTYSLRYERPVKWSDIVEEAAPFVLLRLQDEAGAVGAAEITVKPTWCGVTARSLIATIEEVFTPSSRPLIWTIRRASGARSTGYRKIRRPRP